MDRKTKPAALVSRKGTLNKRRSQSSSSTTFKDSTQIFVNVVVRCRPISDKERNKGYIPIVEFDALNKITVFNPDESSSNRSNSKPSGRGNLSHTYTFNRVFDSHTNQEELYTTVCQPIVGSVLEGYNGTIFAYGQTGTGKTYTMEGSMVALHSKTVKHSSNTRRGGSSESSGVSSAESQTRLLNPESCNELEEQLGIIPRAFKQIFDHVTKHSNTQYLIRASYLEIYQEEIRDLLKKGKSVNLELHEKSDTGVYAKDAISCVCKSITEIEKVMRVGNQNRSVGATDMNEHSSRSHAIFMITIEQQSIIEGNKERQRVIRSGKLNLVDLAGSERQRKTNSSGERQKESIKINLSLAALGNVINALMKINNNNKAQDMEGNDVSIRRTNNRATKSANEVPFIPYRDSKLTRLLQNSLGGNAKTLMIANIGPASYNYDETVNTLNYASRAKYIRNKPKLNEDPKDAMLKELQQEIDELREKLANLARADDRPEATNNPSTISEKETRHKPAAKELATLREKLNSLESKLLNSGRTKDIDIIIDKQILQGYTRDQEQELEKRRAELASQENREKSILGALEKQEQDELLVNQTYDGLQQEVEAKRKLIRQVLLKIKDMREESETTQSSYMMELDELDQLQSELEKELKLKYLIMDNYIPNDHVDQLLSQLSFDEKRNKCEIIQTIMKDSSACKRPRGVELEFEDCWRSFDGSGRPKTETERIFETIYPNDIRYKEQCLIETSIELPRINFRARQLKSRCQPDDELARHRPVSKVQMLVDDALNQREPDIVIK